MQTNTKLNQRNECYFGLNSQQPVADKMFDYLKKINDALSTFN